MKTRISLYRRRGFSHAASIGLAENRTSSTLGGVKGDGVDLHRSRQPRPGAGRARQSRLGAGTGPDAAAPPHALPRQLLARAPGTLLPDPLSHSSSSSPRWWLNVGEPIALFHPVKNRSCLQIVNQ